MAVDRNLCVLDRQKMFILNLVRAHHAYLVDFLMGFGQRRRVLLKAQKNEIKLLNIDVTDRTQIFCKEC